MDRVMRHPGVAVLHGDHMTTSRNFFFWVLSALFAGTAVGMQYFGWDHSFGWLTLAEGRPFDVLLVAYLVLLASYMLTSD
jgi:hypothetical protein